jgi:hypothetical protein
MINKHFLAISYSIPNRATGTPVVIRKFLENFRKDEVVLIGRPSQRKERIKNIHFHYPVLSVPTPPVGFRGEKLWHFLFVILGIFTGLYAIKSYKLRAILAFYRDESSLLLGFILHQITGIPFYAYFFDVYLENYPSGIYGRLARWLQPRVFQKAAKIFVLTEAMQEFFLEKYKVDAIILPHSNNRLPQKRTSSIDTQAPFRIGYLGSINVDRIFSLKTLCDAIKKNEQFHLTYFSATSPEYLSRQGLLIDNSEIKFVASDNELLSELILCDLLFLPVMISNNNRERESQVITGFPTKAIEYLLCQKPILVHSSNHYWAAKFFKKFECGLVVDGGCEDIWEAIQSIKNDHQLRARMTKNSKEALAYFAGGGNAEVFRKVLFSF